MSDIILRLTEDEANRLARLLAAETAVERLAHGESERYETFRSLHRRTSRQL